MKRKQSKQLWSVKFRDRAGFHIGSALLVLADTPTVATNKAERVLKRHGVKGARVDEIKNQGTIDAF